MDGVDVDVADSVITRALGTELRRARNRVGWTRDELARQMPSGLHPRTLATYEDGSRQCTVLRLVEICLALGIAAPDVLGLALQRAEVDLDAIRLQVDLHAIMRDERKELERLRQWAQKRLENDPNAPDVVRLESAAIREMAVLLDYTPSDLFRHLAQFGP